MACSSMFILTDNIMEVSRSGDEGRFLSVDFYTL
jgi:hypothetical protein